MKLHRDLDITQKSAWHLAHRLRKTWDGGEESFSSPVEVDETYVGGKRKNLSGRGSAGKTAVIGAKYRKTNWVAARTIENTDWNILHGFVAEIAADGAKVYTDNAKVYRGISNRKVVCHKLRENMSGVRPIPTASNRFGRC